MSSSTGGRGCDSAGNRLWVSLSICYRVKPWTTWMRTFWRLSTTPRIPNFFNAYLRGKKHHDLRFFVRNRVGALPQLDSPEEVALINYDPEGMDEGVWYLAHLNSEYSNRTASSREDRRLFATRRYKIETVIAKSKHLYSSATITFQPLVAGERVLKFGLLPNLRVTKVTDQQGQNLFFYPGEPQGGRFILHNSSLRATSRPRPIH